MREQQVVELEVQQAAEGLDESVLDRLGVIAHQVVGYEPKPAVVHQTVGERERALGHPICRANSSGAMWFMAIAVTPGAISSPSRYPPRQALRRLFSALLALLR